MVSVMLIHNRYRLCFINVFQSILLVRYSKKGPGWSSHSGLLLLLTPYAPAPFLIRAFEVFIIFFTD